MKLKSLLEVLSNSMYLEIELHDNSIVCDYPERLLSALDEEELNGTVLDVEVNELYADLIIHIV